MGIDSVKIQRTETVDKLTSYAISSQVSQGLTSIKVLVMAIDESPAAFVDSSLHGKF